MAATVLTQIVRARKRVKLDWEAAVTHADAHGVSWGELVRPPPLPTAKKVMPRQLTGKSVLSLIRDEPPPPPPPAAAPAVDLSALTSDLLPPPVGLAPGAADDAVVTVNPDDIIEVEEAPVRPPPLPDLRARP